MPLLLLLPLTLPLPLLQYQQHCHHRILLAFALLLGCCYYLPSSNSFAPSTPVLLRSIRQRPPPQLPQQQQHPHVPPRPNELACSFFHLAQQQQPQPQRWLSTTLKATAATTTTQYEEEEQDLYDKHQDDDSTVTTLLWNHPTGDDPCWSSSSCSSSSSIITLIGTAHLSKKSNAQVQRLMEQIQPNIVLIELDKSRLKRLGISNMKKDIQLKTIRTSDDIPIPQTWDGIPPPLPAKSTTTILTKLLWQPIQQILTDALSRLARIVLTGMYNDMSVSMNTTGDGGGGPGGEFLVAIRAAENCTACDTLILGDRNSVTTIQRAMILALSSGDPWGVWNRLQAVNGMEMEQLAQRVEKELKEKAKAEQAKQAATTASAADPSNNNPDQKSTKVDDIIIDQGAIQVAMMEALKQDSTFRESLFRKLEQQVPEFTQAFLKERDYLMAESIRQELLQYSSVSLSSSSSSSSSVPSIRVVAVVGLAHIPGMVQHLQETANCSIVAKDQVLSSSSPSSLPA
jgi:pheromone shutdown protein TraB